MSPTRYTSETFSNVYDLLTKYQVPTCYAPCIIYAIGSMVLILVVYTTVNILKVMIYLLSSVCGWKSVLKLTSLAKSDEEMILTEDKSEDKRK